MTDYKGVGVTETEEPQFWIIDPPNDQNRKDLERTYNEGRLIPLVDEAVGGIIAYVITGNEDSLLAHLNGPDELQYLYVAIEQTWNYETAEAGDASVSISAPVKKVIAVFDNLKDVMAWCDEGVNRGELRMWVEVPRG